MPHMADLPEDPSTPETDARRALRAQMLATEHWSLLASRSTTQNEVLSRISIFLTLVSAGLVSLALIGQVTRFSQVFPAVAIVLLSFILLVGVLTQLRVINASMDDLMFVVAMNRIRSAYVALDPGIAQTLLTGATDDMAGVQRTYYFPGGRNNTQVLASSMVFTIGVNAALSGVLTCAIVLTSGGTFALSLMIAIPAAVLYLVASMWHGYRHYNGFWRSYEPIARG
jgi:hypothetical protein